MRIDSKGNRHTLNNGSFYIQTNEVVSFRPVFDIIFYLEYTDCVNPLYGMIRLF